MSGPTNAKAKEKKDKDSRRSTDECELVNLAPVALRAVLAVLRLGGEVLTHAEPVDGHDDLLDVEDALELAAFNLGDRESVRQEGL